MMSPRSTKFLWILQLLVIGNVPLVFSSVKPYPLSWNTTHDFGYDGPWHAIPLRIGRPEQTINLYPGGSWASVVLGTHIQDAWGNDYPNQDWLKGSEVWDASLSAPQRSGSSQNNNIAQANRGGVSGSIDGNWGGQVAMNMTGLGVQITDRVYFYTPDNGIAIPNGTLSVLASANMTYPDGKVVPLDMGFLSLGAREAQRWDPYVGNVIPDYLSINGYTPSSSWSLHIGSAVMGIPGSLIFGGYDSTRVIGDIGTYDTTDGFGGMFTELVDVQLGVASGSGSPWSFQNKTNLLQDAGSKTQVITTRMNPTVPYIFLPNRTCQLLAENLPVTWRWDLGLYTWNTEDPQYERILNSPAYIKFVFNRPAGASPIEIRVPFALFNLTLTQPIVDRPTQYFPCRPFQNNGAEYHLGRAFLQAAFLGMNWVTSKWWLAQAPGPLGLASSIVVISNSTETITTSAPSSFWTDSWKGILTSLPIDGNPSSSGSSFQPSSAGNGTESKGALSSGAIAGIAVGASVGGVLILGMLFFFWRTRRTRFTKQIPSPTVSQAQPTTPANTSTDAQKYELPDRQPVAYELMSREQY
ncbi:hypothetical protein KXV89_001553 [Aspergillus fumigatus]|nr:hypothetical protein CNMCM8714_002561 [Aspergillus fumigatus]KAH1403798.1 hypothetical protein KXX51_001123 [Aspergillus fumigatus]KAH1406730.1 hypothetical protein KXX22_001009 [Aspergillus fumigatus]KAH1567908.1 hypothetical protein KXX28_000850 [Aspergillus fumigatus]KAH1572341.1 hypothetical protein KXX17_009577 [Aspergillus fumigatus]